MAKLRLQITMSLDGYVAGPDQNEENPLGVGGLELHEWAFPLKEFCDIHGGEGGETNAGSAVVQERWRTSARRSWAGDAPGVTHIKYQVAGSAG
jgi:hypothetical protein